MAEYGYTGEAPMLGTDSVSTLFAKFKMTLDSLFSKLNSEAGSSVLPEQTGNTGKVLLTSGTSAQWADCLLLNKTVLTMAGRNTIPLTIAELPERDGLSISVYRNGLYQTLGADYTLDRSTRVLTFVQQFKYCERIVILVSAVKAEGAVLTDGLAVPDPVGQSGRILMSDGTAAKWGNIVSLNKTVETVAGEDEIQLDEEEIPTGDGLIVNVFRNGLLQQNGFDYTFDGDVGLFMFNDPFEDGEHVAILASGVMFGADFSARLPSSKSTAPVPVAEEGTGQITVAEGTDGVTIPEGGKWMYVMFENCALTKTGVADGGSSIAGSGSVKCLLWRLS